MDSFSSSSIAAYIADLEYENAKLHQALDEERASRINADKFYAVKLDPPTVAKLHDVDPRTVREYIKLKYIETHPDSTDTRTYIRAAVALKLDFKEMRKISRRS